MEIRHLHLWPKTEEEAVDMQQSLGSRLDGNTFSNDIRLIAGVDTAYDHLTDILYAAVVLFHFPEMKEGEKVTAAVKADFPYIPGLFAFREGPVILKAFESLRTRPDLILFAAHGLAHPRHFGLAIHMGLILDIPSIGCARRHLTGQYQEPSVQKGASSPMYLDKKPVGTVYRSRNNVKPLYISPGYRCSLDDAVQYTVESLRGYRLPEPLRAAHRLANRARRTSQNRRNTDDDRDE